MNIEQEIEKDGPIDMDLNSKISEIIVSMLENGVWQSQAQIIEDGFVVDFTITDARKGFEDE